MYIELLLICYYNTGIEDLIVEILEDIVIINWTPLNYTELTSYVLEYKQTNEQTFRNVTFLISVVSIGLPTLEHDIEYVFQVYGVFTINNVKYESGRSPLVTVMITMDSSSIDSQTLSTGLVAGVSVLSITVIISIVVNIILIVITVILLIKKPKEKERFSIDISNYSMNYILLFLDPQLNLLVIFMKQ